MNEKKHALLLLLFSIWFFPFFTHGVDHSLTTVVNPGRILVDAQQIYIIDGAQVVILNQTDFSVTAHFGQEGEGPGELIPHPNDPMGLDLYNGNILIKSKGRISCFSTDGRYKGLVNSGVGAQAAKGFGSGYVGISRTRENSKNYMVINLYDDQAKKGKELLRLLDDYQPGEGMSLLQSPYEYHYLFAVSGEKLFIAQNTHFAIDVVDTTGSKLYTITHDVQTRNISPSQKTRFLQFWKTDPIKKEYYDFLKPFRVMDSFPPIRAIRVKDNIVYAITHDVAKEGSLCLMFSERGQFIKQVRLPLEEKDPFEHYPYDIAGGKLYQLLEDEDNGWIIRVTTIS